MQTWLCMMRQGVRAGGVLTKADAKTLHNTQVGGNRDEGNKVVGSSRGQRAARRVLGYDSGYGSSER